MTKKQRRSTVDYNFGFTIRPALRMLAVERTLREKGIAVPARRKLIQMVKDGVLQGKKTRLGFIVFEESLLKWINNQSA